jgi:DNA-binding Lrp family transcriptional regulator
MRQVAFIKLSSRDRQLLMVYEHRANHSFRAIAKLLKSRESTVRYRYHALIKRGVILERRPFIDVYALGFCYYKFYLSISPDKKDSLQKAIQYLNKLHHVVWLAQVGGRFQLVLAVCVRSPAEVYQFTQDLGQQLGGTLQSMDVLTQVRFSAFTRKFLAPSSQRGEIFETGCHDPRSITADKIDLTILAGLCSLNPASEAELARALDIPLSTLRRRISALEQQGVIRGYLLRYNTVAIGVSRYCLQLAVKGGTRDFGEKLRRFCALHPNVVNTVELIGPWQFEVTVDVEQAHDSAEILRELYEAFPGEILSSVSVPIFQSHKFTSYSTHLEKVMQKR